MRDVRPVAPAEATAADPFALEASISDGGLSAMRALASAAHIARPGVAPRSMFAPATDPAQVDRIDLSGLMTVQPLHQTTVTGAGAGRPGNHVGGAMLPPPVNTVALSDGTRISFGAVGDVPVLEYA